MPVPSSPYVSLIMLPGPSTMVGRPEPVLSYWLGSVWSALPHWTSVLSLNASLAFSLDSGFFQGKATSLCSLKDYNQDSELNSLAWAPSRWCQLIISGYKEQKPSSIKRVYCEANQVLGTRKGRSLETKGTLGPAMVLVSASHDPHGFCDRISMFQPSIVV